MSVTEAAISSRKEFLEFRDEDVQRLLSIRDLAKEYADPVIEGFYAHLLSFEETAGFFADPKVIARVKQMQKEYFLGLTAGDYGEAYAENRLLLGAVHERVGVPLNAYLGMFSFYLRAVASRLSESFKNDPEQAAETLYSLMKLTFFDIGLAIDTYIFERDSRLKQSEERFRHLAENIPDMIVRIHLKPEPSFEYASPAADAILGYAPAELYAQPELVFQAVHPDDRPLVEQALRAPDGKAFSMRTFHKDGRIVWLEQRAVGVYDESGGLVAVEAISRDISERVQATEERNRLEEQLRQSQKMEAIGNLAGGIAHDFNNLLMVIRGYNAILVKRNTDESLADGLRQIDMATDRATELTRRLLAFSRQQVLRPETTDLNEIVRDTLKLLKRLIGTDVAIVTDLDPALQPVVIDRGQLGQVILNLAVNAREAMPDGGSLTINTTNVELDASYSSEHVDVAAGAYALLQITDSGVGMDEQTRSRIFDPFFTTKSQGTGLGLATVYGIVKQSGGHVFLYSEPGLGTTFKVYFPHGEAAPATALPTEDLVSLRGGETVLLVEDDATVRTLVAALLEMYGYTVLPAAGGREAIEIAEQQHASIDLLLTDIVMPGMNGRELADTLVAEHPTLKVVFTSGYPSDVTVRHGLSDASVAFIEKPYPPEDLARIVRRVLDSPTS